MWIYQNLMLCDKIRERDYYDSLKSLMDNKIFQRESKEFTKSMYFEDSLTAEFTDAARNILMPANNPGNSHSSLSWWDQKINSISYIEKNTRNIYKRNAAKRIKGQLGVMLWEVNRKLMKEKIYNQALELADVLITLDPESDTYLALKAEVLAAQNKTDEAKSYLQKAKDKGFTFENTYLGGSSILKNLDQ